MQNKRLLATAALISLGGAALAATPAFAQATRGGQQQYRAQPPSAAPSAQISDTQIEEYAQAQTKVKSVVQKWQGKLQNADDPKTATKYRQQANQEMVKAVKSTGLSVADYNKISQAARRDAGVAQRIRNAH